MIPVRENSEVVIIYPDISYIISYHILILILIYIQKMLDFCCLQPCLSLHVVALSIHQLPLPHVVGCYKTTWPAPDPPHQIPATSPNKFSWLTTLQPNTAVGDLRRHLGMCQNPGTPVVHIKIAGIYGCSSH